MEKHPMNRWEISTNLFKLQTGEDKTDHPSLQGPTSVLESEISPTEFYVLASNTLFSKKQSLEEKTSCILSFLFFSFLYFFSLPPQKKNTAETTFTKTSAGVGQPS